MLHLRACYCGGHSLPCLVVPAASLGLRWGGRTPHTRRPPTCTRVALKGHVRFHRARKLPDALSYIQSYIQYSVQSRPGSGSCVVTVPAPVRGTNPCVAPLHAPLTGWLHNCLERLHCSGAECVGAQPGRAGGRRPAPRPVKGRSSRQLAGGPAVYLHMQAAIVARCTRVRGCHKAKLARFS